jgi:hypothetical protein
MMLEAIMTTYRARSSINEKLAELQAERERVCECNQPGYQAPTAVEHAPEELAARRAAQLARRAEHQRLRETLRARGNEPPLTPVEPLPAIARRAANELAALLADRNRRPELRARGE